MRTYHPFVVLQQRRALPDDHCNLRKLQLPFIAKALPVVQQRLD